MRERALVLMNQVSSEITITQTETPTFADDTFFQIKRTPLHAAIPRVNRRRSGGALPARVSFVEPEAGLNDNPNAISQEQSQENNIPTLPVLLDPGLLWWRACFLIHITLLGRHCIARDNSRVSRFRRSAGCIPGSRCVSWRTNIGFGTSLSGIRTPIAWFGTAIARGVVHRALPIQGSGASSSSYNCPCWPTTWLLPPHSSSNPTKNLTKEILPPSDLWDNLAFFV